MNIFSYYKVLDIALETLLLKTTDVIFLKKEICRGKKQGKIASIFSTHLCTHTHTHMQRTQFINSTTVEKQCIRKWKLAKNRISVLVIDVDDFESSKWTETPIFIPQVQGCTSHSSGVTGSGELGGEGLICHCNSQPK